MKQALGALGFAAIAALSACGKKDEGQAKPAPPTTCPAGHAVKDNVCVAVVTPEKVQAVAQQQTRLDELAKLLDQAEVVAGPIEILNGLRQTETWQKIAAANSKLQVLEQVVATLDNGVKQLRALKGSLGDASGRLGNLKGELEKLMQETGAAKQLADIQAQVKTHIDGAIQPLATQVEVTIREALVPLSEKLNDTADLVIGGCAMAKVGGGGPDMLKLCGTAKDAFDQAKKFLDDFKTKPSMMFAQLTAELETKLGDLVDAQAKYVLQTAQAKVNDALKLATTPAGSGAGSGSAPAPAPAGSGSAAPAGSAAPGAPGSAAAGSGSGS